ncbi:MAG: GNAT family N-acetyltransferase [Acidimicrobiales bacterium]
MVLHAGNQHTGTEDALVVAGSTELISLDGLHVRLGSWRGSDHIGYLAPLGDVRRRPIEAGLARLRERGFTRVVTSAIAEPDLAAFSGLGFEEHERLHLLAHDLATVESAPWRATRRARPLDRDAVLDIDHAAFQPFWQLDREGLADAISATPTTRYRVTVDGGKPTGYAVFGLAGDRGYLQRLAVHPSHAGHGLGSILIRDGLRWLQRRGASRTLVNTQVTNARALRVYLQHGFVLQSYQLVVLTAALHGGSATT